jgi:Mn2+/Fe2+ NRAMP family transporter
VLFRSGEVALATLLPRVELTRESALMITAVFGTTISPYMFFWQAAQEVEERALHHAEEPKRLTPAFIRDNLDRIRTDTTLGMVVSNIVAFFIMVTTAATLHRAGVTDIQTASQAAEALRPLAGPATFLLFAAGIIGTGLLAVPVLAGSAAYAVAETAGWRGSLEARPEDARGFYAIVAVATLVGVLAGFTPIPAFRLLFWAAVINGLVSVPIMVAMMLVVTNRRIMGRLALGRAGAMVGWLAAGLMALASLALVVSLAP